MTSNLTVPEAYMVKADIIAKQDGVICGIPVMKQVFDFLGGNVVIETYYHEGDRVKANYKIARISGPARIILKGERVVLNFLTHLSGIATVTSKFVASLRGTSCILLDTRKTIPGMRYLEKYAVAVGGGKNHRMGLFDMILVKENHIVAAGGLKNALNMIYSDPKPEVPVEIEVTNLDELKTVMEYPIDRIMLDNFSIQDIKKAIALRIAADKNIPFEVSGGINLENCRIYAETGIEYISSGSLTHSFDALDLTMLISEAR